jgi:hypothetical protein
MMVAEMLDGADMTDGTSRARRWISYLAIATLAVALATLTLGGFFVLREGLRQEPGDTGDIWYPGYGDAAFMYRKSV